MESELEDDTRSEFVAAVEDIGAGSYRELAIRGLLSSDFGRAVREIAPPSKAVLADLLREATDEQISAALELLPDLYKRDKQGALELCRDALSADILDENHLDYVFQLLVEPESTELNDKIEILRLVGKRRIQIELEC